MHLIIQQEQTSYVQDYIVQNTSFSFSKWFQSIPTNSHYRPFIKFLFSLFGGRLCVLFGCAFL